MPSTAAPWESFSGKLGALAVFPTLTWATFPPLPPVWGKPPGCSFSPGHFTAGRVAKKSCHQTQGGVSASQPVGPVSPPKPGGGSPLFGTLCFLQGPCPHWGGHLCAAPQPPQPFIGTCELHTPCSCALPHLVFGLLHQHGEDTLTQGSACSKSVP